MGSDRPRKRAARKGPPWCAKPAGSKHWHYDFRLGGCRYRGSTQTDCPITAEKVVIEIRNKILSGAVAEAQPITVDEAFGRYLLQHAQFQPSYIDAERDARDIAATLGASTPLHALTDDVIAQAVAKWRGQKDRRYDDPKTAPLVSNRTVNARLVRLRSVIETAGKKWGKKVPTIDWSRQALPEPPGRQRYVSLGEADTIVAHAAPHLKPAIIFALWTGLRLSNCITLDWRQVDMQQRTVRVKQKGDRWHSVPLVEPAFLALANIGPQRQGRVFLYRGRPLGSWRKAWRRACERAGVEDLTWHDLRHSFASLLARGGADLRVTKDLMGHSTIATTMRYSHLHDGAERQALERVWSSLSRSDDDPVGQVSDKKEGNSG